MSEQTDRTGERNDGQGAARRPFSDPGSYDRSINWSARFERELPFLMEMLGPAGAAGLLDAGCGTGRHVEALAQQGYRVVGVDASPEMVAFARDVVASCAERAEVFEARIEALAELSLGPMDGVYCLGNSLAAVGRAVDVQGALANFSAVLRPGGKLVIQVLNFEAMRRETPCVRGPRVARTDGTEYVSCRCFHFEPDLAVGPSGRADIVGVSFWQEDGQWRQHAGAGRLYPMGRAELVAAIEQAGFAIDGVWGSYAKQPVGEANAPDVIVAATKKQDSTKG